MSRRVPTGAVIAVVLSAFALVVVALSTSGDSGSAATAAATSDWGALRTAAAGQTVKLWMWGGDDALNQYIDQDVIPAAAAEGVRLIRVPIDDTATAMDRLAAERAAGIGSGGAVDLVWVNGKNFAQGKAAGYWLANWVPQLPNARLLDTSDPTLRTDFGVATDGQEAPWSRAAFVFAYDPTTLVRPPRTFDELAAFVREHPGRFTYPAPPDFTGSAFVRQAVQALGEDKAFEMLAAMRPNLWRNGSSYPKDEPELSRLFASRQVDLAMSYNPNFVDVGVHSGAFAPTVRPYVFASGTLQNVSFVAIPANASSPEGAQVVANVLLSPAMQQRKLDRVGIPSVLDRTQVHAVASGADTTAQRLDDFGIPLEELPVERVVELDKRWRDKVLP